MIPNMYKIAGEMLPGVFHVSARTLSSHALSIFGDHSDVMGVRQTGFSLLASSTPQEVMDLGLWRTCPLSTAGCPSSISLTVSAPPMRSRRSRRGTMRISALWWTLDALRAFRKHSLNPEHPVTRGTTVNPDIFFSVP